MSSSDQIRIYEYCFHQIYSPISCNSCFDFFNWERKKGFFGPLRNFFSFSTEKKNGEKIGENKIRTFEVWSDEPITANRILERLGDHHLSKFE